MIVKKTWKLSKEDKSLIINEYLNKKVTCKSLADKFNVNKVSISQLLKKEKIKINNNQSELQRKYSLNELFFEKIDTEEKAYFLGWLYADGCNYVPSNNVSVVVQEPDVEILHKLNFLIKSDRPIRFIKREALNSKRKNQYRLNINSKKISQDLVKLGCIQNKSLKLEFPTEDQVPKFLMRHFIRGLWEGDGTIFFKKRIKKDGQKSFDYCMGITSTKNFCIGLQSFLFKELGIFTNIHDGNSISKITSNLYYYKIKHILKLAEWIYSESNFKLKRKWNKYQDLINDLRLRNKYNDK